MTRDHYLALVGRIVHVIEVLRDEPQGLSLNEVASRAGYVKSSVHRILHSLLGAVFLAAPLSDSRERVCGSLSIGLPKARSSTQLSREMAAQLKLVCRQLSDKLKAVGYVHVTGN